MAHEERIRRPTRVYRAGKRIWCDVHGHRWLRDTDGDGEAYLECRRCHLLRSGRPITHA
jgi:hypothetical protein